MIHKKQQFIRFVFIFVLMLGMTLFMLGCVPQATEPVEGTFTPTSTLTSTPTIVWFPATETPTIIHLPTATPNPAANPTYGDALISDSFSSSVDWPESQKEAGIITVGNNSITLAVKATRGNLFTLRNNTIVSDFYLETTVKRIALCKNDDQFGVVFRAQNEYSFYRLMMNCQGQVALQQMVNSTPTFLINWINSSEISLWEPFTVGVWAKGSLMRIYINNNLQGEVTRGTFASGGIGYYARAAADTPLTVSFSNLTVHQLTGSSIEPSPTVSPTK
jgi:hypothetical protein